MFCFIPKFRFYSLVFYQSTDLIYSLPHQKEKPKYFPTAIRTIQLRKHIVYVNLNIFIFKVFISESMLLKKQFWNGKQQLFAVAHYYIQSMFKNKSYQNRGAIWKQKKSRVTNISFFMYNFLICDYIYIFLVNYSLSHFTG